MKPEKVQISMTERVREHHRIAERRGMVGRIADHYGGDGYMAVDVRFSGGHRRLFWPEDLKRPHHKPVQVEGSSSAEFCSFFPESSSPKTLSEWALTAA